MPVPCVATLPSAPVLFAIVPPVPALPVPVMVNDPFVFDRMIPLALPLLELTFVSDIPSVVSPAGPVTEIAVPLLASTVPVVMLIVPSAVVATIPLAAVVKILTVPRLYVPVPPVIVICWLVARLASVPNVRLVKETLPSAPLILTPVLFWLPVIVPVLNVTLPAVVLATLTIRAALF